MNTFYLISLGRLFHEVPTFVEQDSSFHPCDAPASLRFPIKYAIPLIRGRMKKKKLPRHLRWLYTI